MSRPSSRKGGKFATLGNLAAFGLCLVKLHAAAPGTIHEFGDSNTSLRPAGLADAIDVKAAQRYTCALRSNGTIALWGFNDNLVLNAPPDLTNVIAIAAGYYMPMALTEDGRVHVWGASGHVFQGAIVTPPPTATNVIAIAAGLDHCLALRADGTVVAWGGDQFQQTQVPAGLSNVVQVAAGQAYSLALKSDGALVTWGNQNFYGSIPPSASNIVQLAAGVFGHVLALRSDGTVVAWSGSPRPEAAVPPDLTNVVAIAAGSQHSLALKSDGTLVAWGNNQNGQATVPTNFVRAHAIAAGASHNVVLSSAPVAEITGNSYRSETAGNVVILQGSVACPVAFNSNWRKNGIPLGITNTTLTIENVQGADAGTYVLSASNAFGGSLSPVILLDVLASAPKWIAQPEHQPVLPGGAAHFAGSAKGTEPLSYRWLHRGQPIPDATNTTLTISPVAAADEGVYTLVVSNLHGSITSAPAHLVATLPVLPTSPGNLWARTNWTVSLDSEVISPTPVTYVWFKDGVLLSDQTGPQLVFDPLQPSDAGAYVLHVSNAAGTVTNGPVQVTVLDAVTLAPPGIIVDFGNPPFTGPFVVEGVTNAVAIAAGGGHIVSMLEDGSIKVLADPQNLGLLNIPPSVTNVLQVFAGPTYAIALRENGTAVKWGGSEDAHEFDASNVVDIAAASNHQLLLLANGTVVRSSNASVPANVTNVIDVAASSEFSFALRADGRVLKWNNSNGSPGGPLAEVIAGLDGVIQLAGGKDWVSYALRADGRAVTLGQSGNWDFIQGVTNAVSISAGGGFVALLETGEVWGQKTPYGLRADGISSGQLRIAALTSAPFFNVPPKSELLYSGVDAVLTTDVRSSTPVSLQWYRNGQPVPGGTNAVLPLPEPRPSDGGIFHVVAQNAQAQTVSTTAVITVTGPPELLAVSGDRELVAGDPLHLQAEFASHPSPMFFWRFNGSPIPHATNSSLLLPHSTEQMTGAYSVTVSNIHGLATSNGIQVIVSSSAPRILAEPAAPSTVPDGSDVELLVEAVGSLPLSYQWTFNDQPIAGETQPLLRLASVSAAADGIYRATVTNVHGSVTSAPVVITTTRAAPSPEIVSATRLVREGKALLLKAAARGTSGGEIQWLFNGVELPEETNSVLLVEPATLNDSGAYSARAANAHGTNESAPVTVTVLRNPGAGFLRVWSGGILGQPLVPEFVESVRAGLSHGVGVRPDGSVYVWGNNLTGQLNVPAGLTNVVEVAAGQAFSLALRPDGTVVGWGRNDFGQCTPPPGLTGVIAIAAGVSHSLALKTDGSIVAWGNPSYRAVPTNLPPAIAIAAGPTYSVAVAANGTVRVWGTPSTLTTVPSFITNTVAVAASANQAYALDTSGVARVWPSASGTLMEGTNLTMIAAGPNHAAGLRTDGRIVTWGSSLIHVVGPRGASNVLSIAAGDQSTLAILGEPRILSRPPSQTVKEGASVTLNVGALGTPPLGYRWRLGGSLIPDATNATLHIGAFNATHSGLYTVEVTNRFASAITNFSITLGLPPAITAQPADQAVRFGSNATFSVQGSGTPILRYQWALNGTNLLGATAPSLTLTNVLFQDEGFVSVVVSNAFGIMRSRDAALMIAPPELTLSGAGNPLRLRVSGLFPNRTHTLLASSNLVDWIPFETLIGAGADAEIEVPEAHGPVHFYQLSSPPRN